MVAVGELDGSDGVLDVVLSGTVVANESVGRNVLVHLSYNYNIYGHRQIATVTECQNREICGNGHCTR